ncbi:unnamed protein product [Gordionus sp. m RMFG-2023]
MANPNLKLLVKRLELTNYNLETPMKKAKLFEAIPNDIAMILIDEVDDLSYEELKKRLIEMGEPKKRKNKVTQILELNNAWQGRYETTKEYLSRLKSIITDLPNREQVIANHFIATSTNYNLQSKLMEEERTSLEEIEMLVNKLASVDLDAHIIDDKTLRSNEGIFFPSYKNNYYRNNRNSINPCNNHRSTNIFRPYNNNNFRYNSYDSRAIYKPKRFIKIIEEKPDIIFRECYKDNIEEYNKYRSNVIKQEYGYNTENNSQAKFDVLTNKVNKKDTMTSSMRNCILRQGERDNNNSRFVNKGRVKFIDEQFMVDL